MKAPFASRHPNGASSYTPAPQRGKLPYPHTPAIAPGQAPTPPHSHTPLLLFLLFLPSLALRSEDVPPGTALQSRIDRVLVYSDQAIVTRVAELTLKADAERCLLPDLPAGLEDDSVRVRLEGPGEPKMLNLEVILVHRTEYRKEEAKQAADELKKLDRDAQALNDRMAELDRRAGLLRSFQVGALPRGKDEKAEPVPLSTDAWGTMLGTIVDGLAAISTERLKLEEEMDNLQSQTVVARARANRLLSYEQKSSMTVAIEIRGRAGTKVSLAVSYLILGPQWFPRYNVRADLAAGSMEVTIDALVRQNTGEDWSEAELSFSAASPSQSADLPKLLAWHISPAWEAEEVLATAIERLSKKPEEGAASLEKQTKELRVYDVRDELTATPDYKGTSLPKIGGLRKRAAAASAEARSAEPSKPEAVSKLQESLKQTEASSGQTVQPQRPAAQPVPALPATQAPAAQVATQQKRTAKTQQLLSKVSELYSQQKKALQQGDYRSYELANGEIVQILEQDADAQKVYIGYLAEARDNLKRVGRLVEAQRLATGVVSPLSSSGGYDYRYQGLKRETVPSDWVFSKVTLAAKTIPAKFFYEVVPELARRAYLVALLENTFRSPLLEGPSGIFLGNDFVTQGRIKTTGSGEQVRVELGVDEGIAVSRTVESKRQTEGVLSGKFAFSHAITVTVRNDKARDVAVHVLERIPVPSSKQVVVADETALPKPTKAAKNGLRRWEFDLKPATEQKITYSYSVTHSDEFRTVLTPVPMAIGWDKE